VDPVPDPLQLRKNLATRRIEPGTPIHLQLLNLNLFCSLICFVSPFGPLSIHSSNITSPPNFFPTFLLKLTAANGLVVCAELRNSRVVQFSVIKHVKCATYIWCSDNLNIFLATFPDIFIGSYMGE
jgi:hypothetical protein